MAKWSYLTSLLPHLFFVTRTIKIYYYVSIQHVVTPITMLFLVLLELIPLVSLECCTP